MLDSEMTQAQLLAELRAARQKIADLERSQSASHDVDDYTLNCDTQSVLSHVTDTDNLLLLNDSGVICAASANTANEFGLSIEDLVGKNIFTFLPNDVAANRRQVLEEVVKSGKTTRFVDERSGKFLDHIVTPLIDAAGNVSEVFVVARDITLQKQTEEKLKDSEERFRTTFDQAAVGIFQGTPCGSFLYANKKFCDITGYALDEIIGKSFRDFTHPDDIARDDEQLAEMISGECATISSQKRYRRKDGSYVWVMRSASPVYDDNGKLKYVMAVVEDITERKKAEESLLAALKEKEVLLREIHHRVKNNLQIISSLLSLKEQEIDHPVAQEALAESRGRVFSMAMIHEHLYRANDLNAVDFDDYLRKYLPRSVASLKGNRDIGLRLDLSAVFLPIDRAIPLGLILNELVTNSLKHGFRTRDSGTIHVSTVQREGTVHISVADDGEGLPDNFNIEKVKTLGLQICTVLSRQLSGTFTLDSGRETMFCLSFPNAVH